VEVRSFVWRDVSGSVGGGGNDGSSGSWTVVSSDIHPPFRIVTSRHDGGLEREGKKFCRPDVSRGSWVFPIEVRDDVWCMNVLLRFPRVVLYSEAFPFH
jgi:hypothetical protein